MKELKVALSVVKVDVFRLLSVFIEETNRRGKCPAYYSFVTLSKCSTLEITSCHPTAS